MSEDGSNIAVQEASIAEAATITHFVGPEETGRVLACGQYFRTCFEYCRFGGYSELYTLTVPVGFHGGSLHEHDWQIRLSRLSASGCWTGQCSRFQLP